MEVRGERCLRFVIQYLVFLFFLFLLNSSDQIDVEMFNSVSDVRIHSGSMFRHESHLVRFKESR